MSSRRAVLAVAGAGFVLAVNLSLAGCRFMPGDNGEVLRVGSQKGGTKALMLAAGALSGAAYRVEWSEFPAAQPLLEAIGSGAVDVGLAGDAPFLFAYEAGGPIQAVSAQHVDPRPSAALAIVVPQASPIRDIGGLKGRRIATTRGSVGHYLVLRALERQGWHINDVRITFLAPSDSAAALSAGAVDAWSTWVPYVSLALAGGGRIVVDGQDLVGSYSFDVANSAIIGPKRAILTDFLAREARALRWALAHPDAYARVLAAETGLPLAIAGMMVRKNARLTVPIDAPVILEQRQVLDTFAHAGEVTPRRALSQAFAPLLGVKPA